MTSKFNADKHRRRLRKEKENRRINHLGRTAAQCNEARIRVEARQRREEYLRRLEAEKLADPRWPYFQAIANVLAAVCWCDPAFRLLALQEALKQVGIPYTPAVQIINGVPIIVVESARETVALVFPIDEKNPSEGSQSP